VPRLEVSEGKVRHCSRFYLALKSIEILENVILKHSEVNNRRFRATIKKRGRGGIPVQFSLGGDGCDRNIVHLKDK